VVAVDSVVVLAASGAAAAVEAAAAAAGRRIDNCIGGIKDCLEHRLESETTMVTVQRIAVRVLLIALVTLPLGGCSYNRFVGQEEAVKQQWAQVQNQLQRRNDLIPNLVETVKGYAAHEEGIFKDIADARSRLLAARSPEETMQAAQQQTSALGRLLAVAENYPNLKANEQFNRLSDELAGTENRIAVERMRYNERIQEYNTARRQFPGNITAKLFSFKDYPLFEAAPEAKEPPRVNFSK
jgi:LemA protein